MSTISPIQMSAASLSADISSSASYSDDSKNAVLSSALEQRRRRSAAVFATQEQLDVLNVLIDEFYTDAVPSDRVATASAQTGLAFAWIKNWLRRKRGKIRKSIGEVNLEPVDIAIESNCSATLPQEPPSEIAISSPSPILPSSPPLSPPHPILKVKTEYQDELSSPLNPKETSFQSNISSRTSRLLPRTREILPRPSLTLNFPSRLHRVYNKHQSSSLQRNTPFPFFGRDETTVAQSCMSLQRQNNRQAAHDFPLNSDGMMTVSLKRKLASEDLVRISSNLSLSSTPSRLLGLPLQQPLKDNVITTTKMALINTVSEPWYITCRWNHPILKLHPSVAPLKYIRALAPYHKPLPNGLYCRVDWPSVLYMMYAEKDPMRATMGLIFLNNAEIE